MNLEVLPFEMSHLDTLKERSVFHDRALLEERIRTVINLPYSIIASVRMQDKTLAVFGLLNHRPRYAQVWSLTSDDICKVPIAFHKVARSMLQHFEKRFDLQRVEISVKEDYAVGVKWARSLGFTCEGLMRKFASDGSNHYLFARIT